MEKHAASFFSTFFWVVFVYLLGVFKVEFLQYLSFTTRILGWGLQEYLQ
jgi:hypothetical protein